MARASLGTLLFLALVFGSGCGSYWPGSDNSASPDIAPEQVIEGKVVLGSPRLTAGIPGRAALTIPQIKAWLADPKNHEPLEFVLPLGLREAAGDVHIPPDNPLTRAKIELGRQLFFDRRLTVAESFSCSSCHISAQAYAAYQVMPEIGRNTLPAFNRILSREQFWDGRAKSLEDQPLSPIENRFEMRSSPEECTNCVAKIEGYRLQFESIFGEVSFPNICKALACFERALVSGPSAWDFDRELARWKDRNPSELSLPEREEYQEAADGAAAHPLSAAARRGRDLFFGERGGCGVCHSGSNLSDESYHFLGLPPLRDANDLGRFALTERENDRRAFKTPTLRNVALTPPYMHDGRFHLLAQVVAWFSQRERIELGTGDDATPLLLSEDEQRDLLEFLQSLNSPLPPVESGRLPP